VEVETERVTLVVWHRLALFVTFKGHRQLWYIDYVDSPVEHEGEIKDTVEQRHHQVGHGQVHQEVISHRLHPPMGCSRN
jgi:hypothetical protein